MNVRSGKPLAFNPRQIFELIVNSTAEMLALLDAKEGDNLFVVRGDDGSLKIMTQNPDLAAALSAAEEVMDENRDLLQALA